MRVVLDTNIIIGILGDKLSYSIIEQAQEVVVSAITIMELYALAGMSKEEERRVEKLIAPMIVEPFDEKRARRAGVLARTRTKRRDWPDLIIAVTALECDAILITKNIKDFRDIPDLKAESRL